jgi:hypothetical protein
MITFEKDNNEYSLKINKENVKNNIIVNDLIVKNDVFEKYNYKLEIEGEIIICKDKTKSKNFINKIKKETYEEYLNIINSYNIEKDKWIYNILDKISEEDKIIYESESIIIIPNYTWDNINIENFYLLTIPKNKKLRTIRDLIKDDIILLKEMKEKTEEVINNKYNYNNNEIKMYFHYSPSTYHLHMHSCHVKNKEVNSSVEYSHDIDNIIFNLEMNSNYYKLINLKKRI